MSKRAILPSRKTEDVSDRLVLQPVRLPLEQFAFEIADYFAVSDND